MKRYHVNITREVTVQVDLSNADIGPGDDPEDVAAGLAVEWLRDLEGPSGADAAMTYSGDTELDILEDEMTTRVTQDS